MVYGPSGDPDRAGTEWNLSELTFELATSKPISEQKTKFNSVVAHLPPNIATAVHDVIIRLDQVNLY